MRAAPRSVGERLAAGPADVDGTDGSQSRAGAGEDPLGPIGWTVVLTIAGVGALGVGYSVGFFFGSGAAILARLVTLSLPFAVSCVLLYVAVGLYRGSYDVTYAGVLKWTVIGFATLAVLGMWYPMAVRLGTYEQGFAFFLTFSAGALAGVLLGLYNSQRVRIEELERYEAIVESVRDGVFAVDENGDVTLVNPAMAELLGADRNSLEGADVSHLASKLLSDDQIAESGSVAGALDDLGDSDRVEVEFQPVGRGPITCELGVSSIDAGDGTEQIVGVTRDVSRYKRLQQQLSVSNRILRHNLRTSMNVIAGQSRVLEVDAPDEEAAERARTVRKEAEELSGLADKARLLSEIIEHEYDSGLVETDAGSVARDAVGVVREEFPDAVYEVDAPTGRPVRAHPQIARAVAETVENAIVHSDAAVPTVWVTVETTDGFLEIRVADEGPGIPHYEREVLSKEAETDLDHGSGLGLWLINWIVDLSDGELQFGENEPRGSVVTIRLPAVDRPTAGERGQPS